jgi:hypothetical protein
MLAEILPRQLGNGGGDPMTDSGRKPRNQGEAMKEAVYGFPCVENPHDFEPDRDCCTEKEIAFWEEAKTRWDAGEKDVRGRRCQALQGDRGEYLGHVTQTSWGIGVNMVDMEEEFESEVEP